MKKILTLVFVSVLGGAITLSAYKLWIEKNESISMQSQQEQPHFIPTNYKTSTANLIDEAHPSFVNAAEKTIHAVVHVKNTTMSSGQLTFEDLFFGRRSQRPQIGTGSGVIISPDGYIITNNHVIDGAQNISITLNNNKIYDAELIGTDAKTDIALLKVNADNELPFVTFGDSDAAKIGEWVLAVGNPFNLTSTVTAGIISAKARDLSGRNSQSFIQTDAAVNPGNSGGALVNSSGELVGINTAISSQTGSYIGYSFAVPSNIARKVVEDIMEFGDVQTGILGVSILNKNSKEAIDQGLNEINGVYISEVTENSGAKKAGIQSGDIIKKLDDIEISKFSDLSGYLSTKRPNDVVNVELLRDDKVKTFSVTLSKNEILTFDFMNMQLKNLPDNFKKQNDISHGVVVQENKNSWLYSKLGITKGYIITDINDKKINSVEDLKTIKEKYGNTLEDNIDKIGLINRQGKREQFIFR
ncbi:trypsin-like peptidase domain-containing protein [Ichthyenterobacterium magnum]|uniref:Do/DeqQ family serine protease n=1 Tax=Ichthyenterobacterium magnum TaxID=1230530 RepID=A0A420DLH5_9FLAO|nr:trypsin-like peptidase domain-containing protein [Ichthyenterobacterium magnum]RKE95051.1 Do/DeqQ family serine protease [Ichthyenterobacterium magnum]